MVTKSSFGKLRFGAVATLLLTLPVMADTTLHYTVQGECPALADSVQVSGSLMRLDEHAGNQDRVSIFDGIDDVYTTLSPQRHQYRQVEVDEDAADDDDDVADNSRQHMDNRMQKVQGLLQKQCAQNPGGACAAMPDPHSLLQSISSAKPRVELHDLGHTKSVAGANCNVYELTENGIKTREVCYAQVSELPIPADDREGLGRGLQALNEYDKARGGMIDQVGATSHGSADQPQGFPMAQTCFDASGQTLGQAAADISQEAIAADRFDIPTDYTKATALEDPGGN